jgi:hypothetical protein
MYCAKGFLSTQFQKVSNFVHLKGRQVFYQQTVVINEFRWKMVTGRTLFNS